MNDFIIDVKNVCKSFNGRKVVDNFSLKVKQGDIYGFLGPNGSGKTTSIRMICGLLTPDAPSQGTCLGYDILTQADQIKREVGYMTQRFSLYEDLSIVENLDFMARVYGIKKRKQKVAQVLDELGLAGRKKQLAGELSGGWKQRLALACALLHDPKLLLLDEPTAGVDPSARRHFWDQIHELSARGITTLVSTHYMDEAERCKRIAYLAYGKLLAEGTISEVLAQVNLTTWQIRGHDLSALSQRLRETSAVDLVIAFGETLHVSGRDQKSLAKIVKPLAQQDYQLQKVEANLEDTFVYLVSHAEDNFL